MNYKGNDKYGALPRRTVIANQPHMLAYINPQEEMLLRQLGGTGQAGPMGVPAYPPGDGGFSPDGGGGYGGGGGFGGYGGSEGGGGGYNDAADAIAAAQQQAIDNAAAMAAADAAIAGQIEAAAQEEANAAAMAEAEAEAEAIAIQDPSGITNTSGATTTSIVGTSMFDNMRALRGLPPLGEIEVTADDTVSDVGRADADFGMGSIDGVSDVGVSDIGSGSGFLGVSDGGSGYVDPGVSVSAGTPDFGYDFGAGSIDGVSDEGTGNIGSGGVDFDSGGDYLGEFGGGGVDLGGSVSAGTPDLGFDFGMGSDDGVGTSAGEEDVGISIDPYDNPYAIDITDTNIYTENPDGTYTVEDGEPDPIEMGGDGEGEPPANGGDGNGIDTTETTATTSIQDPAEYFNLRRSTAPSGWMSNSIWSSAGKGPDFDVDVYQEADGSLRFRETGELIPTEYLKYIDLARRTEMKAPGEEEDIIDEIIPLDDDTVVDTMVDTVVEPLDDDTIVEPLDDDTVVDTVVETITPSSTAITSQRADGSDMTDMTTIVEGPTDYSMDPDVAESTASTLSGRAQGYYDLVSSGEKGLYEVYEQSLNNRRNRNPMARQAAQDAVDEYLYNNLTPDELRAWQDGQFNPITDPTSSVYNPQGIPEGLL